METKFSEADVDVMIKNIIKAKKLCRVMTPKIKEFYKLNFNEEVYGQIDEAVSALTQVFATLTIHYSSLMFGPIKQPDYDRICKDVIASLKIIDRISEWSANVAKQSIKAIKEREDDLFKDSPYVHVDFGERKQGVGFFKSIINFIRNLVKG